MEVKRYYAELALDTERPVAIEERMAENKRTPSPEEIAWAKKCGERLKWVREAAGYTQGQVADMLQIGQQAISNYESGRRGADPYIMLQFCARFRTTLDYVYRGTLEGVHPGLAQLLLSEHPELAQPPTRKGSGKDKVRDEYREAIKDS